MYFRQNLFMEKYRALIIDDEEDSRSNTKNMLQNHCPEIEVIGEAASGTEGRQKIQELLPDVVFLDINMPDMSGFQMLEGIYDRDFCVVFLTAYSEHGITAVKSGATDYLLKPLIISELQGAVKKVEQHYQSKGFSTNAKHDTNKKVVLITHVKGFNLVEFKDIIRLEPDGNYTNFYIVENKKILSSRTLKEYESILPDSVFYRISRFCLVNINFVKEFNNREGGEVVLLDGTHIQLSKSRVTDFAKFIKAKSITPQ